MITWLKNWRTRRRRDDHTAIRIYLAGHGPAHSMPHRTPEQLMDLARLGIEEARTAPSDGQRLATAHLAAVRAAAAVLASRGRPDPKRHKRITSVWVLLIDVAPELYQWANWFGARHTAPEAGLVLTNAELFVKEVQRLLDEDRWPAVSVEAAAVEARRMGEDPSYEGDL